MTSRNISTVLCAKPCNSICSAKTKTPPTHPSTRIMWAVEGKSDLNQTPQASSLKILCHQREILVKRQSPSCLQALLL